MAGTFQTQDMILATLLSMEEFTFDLYRDSSDRGVWEFSVPDDAPRAIAFASLVNQYNERAYMVEPKQFMGSIYRIRKQLYSFLGKSSRVPTNA